MFNKLLIAALLVTVSGALVIGILDAQGAARVSDTAVVAQAQTPSPSVTPTVVTGAGNGRGAADGSGPVRLRQILSNLLTNAVWHTPSGGEIRLAVEAKAGAVTFRVRNTGSRLSPEAIADAFTPLWRADDARERDRSGSGLGLAISRQLAALHGGRLWAESGADWTTFVAEFPLSAEQIHETGRAKAR